MTVHDIILRQIDGWRAARRAAVSDDYRDWRDIYERMARDYALALRRNLGGRL